MISVIENGIKKLEHTNDKYLELKTQYEKILNEQNGFTEDNNCELKIESIESRIKYVNFIIAELRKINEMIEIDEKLDFCNHCIYFGSGNFYYSSKFKNLSDDLKFDTILNHIVYYTGGLYLIKDDNIKLSYIVMALSILFYIDIDLKLRDKIYETYENEFEHKILNISNRNFIFNNINLMKFLIKSKYDYLYTYRILLGDIISLQNIKLKIKNLDNYAISSNFSRETKFSPSCCELFKI